MRKSGPCQLRMGYQAHVSGRGGLRRCSCLVSDHRECNRGYFETTQAWNDDKRAPPACREVPLVVRGWAFCVNFQGNNCTFIDPIMITSKPGYSWGKGPPFLGWGKSVPKLRSYWEVLCLWLSESLLAHRNTQLQPFSPTQMVPSPSPLFHLSRLNQTI